MRYLIFISTFCLFAVAFSPNLGAQDDPIKAKIDKAKEAHQLEAEKLRAAVLDHYEKSEETARKSGNKKLVDQIKADRLTFEETNEFTRAMPTTIKERVLAAHRKLDEVYSQAIKDYTKAKMDDRAAAITTELQRARLLAAYCGVEVKPIGVWTFEKDANDLVGQLQGELLHGAKVEKGRLKLDGEKARMISAPLGTSVTERTLEVWAIPAKATGRHEVICAIESKWDPWDGLVLWHTREWFAGSSWRHRSQVFSGGAENALADRKPIHVALSYAKNGQIAAFRNGKPYGTPFTPTGESSSVQTYEKGVARIVLGASLYKGKEEQFCFTGEIEEFRLYPRAMSAAQVEASFLRGFAK